jgi:hypothetical protein
VPPDHTCGQFVAWDGPVSRSAAAHLLASVAGGSFIRQWLAMVRWRCHLERVAAQV